MLLSLLHQHQSYKLNMHHIARGSHTRPGTVKKQMALERATHKTHPRIVETQLRILLSEVLIVVILRGHLHEVASSTRVEEVVHCSGRSGKTVKRKRRTGVRPYHY